MDGNEQPGSVQYYPIFVSLNRRVCLVVGGGSVGERKIRGLIKHGASIRLVAKNPTPWLLSQWKEGRIDVVGEDYEEGQLEDVDLVFAATDDPPLNLRVGADAEKRKLWCNLASNPGEGSFIVPSIFQRGRLKIAISTSGLSPAIARQIREKLEEDFDAGWIFFVELMGLLRIRIQAKGLKSSENQRLFREISRLPIAECFRKKQDTHIIASIHGICQPWLNLQELNQIWDEIWKRCSSSSPHCATSAEPSDT